MGKLDLFILSCRRNHQVVHPAAFDRQKKATFAISCAPSAFDRQKKATFAISGSRKNVTRFEVCDAASVTVRQDSLTGTGTGVMSPISNAIPLVWRYYMGTCHRSTTTSTSRKPSYCEISQFRVASLLGISPRRKY
eukprot:820221-Rhodomonas_salina.2